MKASYPTRTQTQVQNNVSKNNKKPSLIKPAELINVSEIPKMPIMPSEPRLIPIVRKKGVESFETPILEEPLIIDAQEPRVENDIENYFVPKKQAESMYGAIDQTAYDKSIAFGKQPLKKPQDLHCFEIRKVPERSVKELNETPSVEDIDKANLTYGYGQHNEQGRKQTPVKLPMDRIDRPMTRGIHEVGIRNIPEYRPTGLYELSGIYGKNRIDYNKKL